MSAYSIVYLAEKHSIAEALADVLPGRSVKRNGYIECGSAAVTWLSGHLLEQAPPEAYDPAYKRWSRETLPIVPEVFKYTVRRDRNIPKQLAVIKNLLRESPSAVNAADFDREGQLLVDEVLELVRYKGQVLRLKTRALDRTSLTRELGRMAPDGEFAGMRDAARARSELDWLAGMNLTRAMTIYGRSVSPSGVLSLGRVQTPTLALVVERDETIENFVPKTFYKVSCPFTAAAGTFVTLLNPRPDMEGLDEEKRLVDKKTALAVRDAVSFGDGTVTGVETQRRADPAPLPYSLTDIQKEASALYGMGASAVLDCCQELYEARFTSYPRTDCRYLPFEQFGEARDVLAAIGHLPGTEAMLAAADPERRGACWNTARVTAHHAIIPTAVPARGLSETQEKIYRLICRRYVWQFLPPHIYKKTRIDVSCAGYDWRADGRTEVSPGWYAFRKAGLSDGTKEKENKGTRARSPAPCGKGRGRQSRTGQGGRGTDHASGPFHGRYPRGGHGEHPALHQGSFRRGQGHSQKNGRPRHSGHPRHHHLNAPEARIPRQKRTLPALHAHRALAHPYLPAQHQGSAHDSGHGALAHGNPGGPHPLQKLRGLLRGKTSGAHQRDLRHSYRWLRRRSRNALPPVRQTAETRPRQNRALVLALHRPPGLHLRGS